MCFFARKRYSSFRNIIYTNPNASRRKSQKSSSGSSQSGGRNKSMPSSASPGKQFSKRSETPSKIGPIESSSSVASAGLSGKGREAASIRGESGTTCGKTILPSIFTAGMILVVGSDHKQGRVHEYETRYLSNRG